MLSPKALELLFQNTDILYPSVQSTVNDTITFLQGNSSFTAFVLPNAYSASAQSLQQILEKTQLSETTSIVLLNSFKSQFDQIPNPSVIYLDASQEFDAKHYFTSFRKSDKNVILLPSLESILDDPILKKKFWTEVLRPLSNI